MIATSPKPPNSIFSNAGAREYGFTDEFWYQVYQLYMKALADDPCMSFEKFDIERTIRQPFGQEQIDVLVRSHPDAREYQHLRFTAFPAGEEEDVQQVSRWYVVAETFSVLGEAVLLDYSSRW